MWYVILTNDVDDDDYNQRGHIPSKTIGSARARGKRLLEKVIKAHQFAFPHVNIYNTQTNESYVFTIDTI